MSTLLNFIKKLNMRIEKPVVMKDTEATLKELQTMVVPMLKEMSEQAKIAPFKSKYFNNLSSHVYAYVKFARKSNNFWLDLGQAFSNVSANCDELHRLVEEYLAQDTLRDAISARGANLVRMAGVMSFVSSYATAAMDFAVQQESVALGNSDETPPAQYKYMFDEIEKFSRLLADVSIDPKQFKTLFTDIPEVYLSADNMASAAAMFAEKELDPFSNLRGVSNWVGSPIYSIRLAYETWQADRFHAAKDRKKMLELRLIHLQNQLEKSPNPRLEKEIEGLQARINKYDRKFREIEASL